MKSLKFLIDGPHQAKSFSAKKGESTWSCIIISDKTFLSNYISSTSLRNFLSKNINCCMVKAESYSVMIDEVGNFRRLNLSSIPVKNTQNLGF